MRNRPGILSALKISSKDQLRNYIDSKYGKSEGPIRILKKPDLGLDSEDRTYDEIVEFENAIIDVAKLSIRDAHKINFINCVFTGDVHVTQHEEEPPIEILFHRSVCIGEITVGGLGHTGRVAFDMVTAPELRMTASKIQVLEFTACHFGKLSIEDVEARTFDTYANRFDNFEVSAFRPQETKFDHSQVCLRGRRRKFNSFKLLTFPKTQEREDRDQKRASSMQFLLQHTGIHRDRAALAHAKYLLSVASKRQLWARGILRVSGAFIKPARIGALAALAFVLYVGVFCLPRLSFIVTEYDVLQKSTKQEVRNLSLREAIYFAGVTFTTIGYGDIAPLGTARYVAVSEGAVGVTLLSALLVAMTRKYVD